MDPPAKAMLNTKPRCNHPGGARQARMSESKFEANAAFIISPRFCGGTACTCRDNRMKGSPNRNKSAFPGDARCRILRYERRRNQPGQPDPEIEARWQGIRARPKHPDARGPNRKVRSSQAFVVSLPFGETSLRMDRNNALAYPDAIRSKSQDPFILHACKRPAPNSDITGMCGFP